MASLLFWSSVVMFPRVYWFLCVRSLKTVYAVGKLTPELIKKFFRENKRNALDPPASSGL